MVTYFFDYFDGKQFHPDLHGMEVDNHDDATDQAASLAHDLLAERTTSTGPHAVSVTVRSASGARIYVAHCSFHGLRIQDPAAER